MGRGHTFRRKWGRVVRNERWVPSCRAGSGAGRPARKAVRRRYTAAPAAPAAEMLAARSCPEHRNAARDGGFQVGRGAAPQVERSQSQSLGRVSNRDQGCRYRAPKQEEEGPPRTAAPRGRAASPAFRRPAALCRRCDARTTARRAEGAHLRRGFAQEVESVCDCTQGSRPLRFPGCLAVANGIRGCPAQGEHALIGVASQLPGHAGAKRGETRRQTVHTASGESRARRSARPEPRRLRALLEDGADRRQGRVDPLRVRDLRRVSLVLRGEGGCGRHVTDRGWGGGQEAHLVLTTCGRIWRILVHEELLDCVGMTLETVDDIPVESPGDVTVVSHGCTSLKLRFRTDPPDADTIVAVAAPSDAGSQKRQGDGQQGGIARVSLAHLATPLDDLSEAQKRSLEILKKVRSQATQQKLEAEFRAPRSLEKRQAAGLIIRGPSH
eukprot:gene16942-biopygen4650